MKKLFPGALACYFFTAMFFAGLPGVVNAQLSGSAGIVTNTNITIPAGQQCTTLRATVTGGNQSSSYLVHQIAYNPPVAYNAGTTVLYHTDDLWTQPLTMPFNFCYFGNTYNNLIIGSNGEVSFNIANAGINNNWSIPGPLPNVNLQADQGNTIMAPWQDLDPTYSGSLQYTTGGVAPNRYFTVSWYNTPMYGDSGSVDNSYCNRLDHQTSMVVLYETSNNIDIYIERKDTICTSLNNGGWNNDWAIEGITGPGGVNSYTVPGRNATAWTAYNDAWRFSPAGAPNNTLPAWFETGVQIASGDTLVVCPTGPTNYTVQSTLTNCDNSTVTFIDTIRVGIRFWFDTAVVVAPNCMHNGSIRVAPTGGANPLKYAWSNGDTTALVSDLIPGTYVVTVTDSIGRAITDTIVLVDSLYLGAGNGVVTQPGCLTGGSINFGAAPGLNNTDAYSWSNHATTANIGNLSAGIYTVTITDTAGCTVTASYTLTQPTLPGAQSFSETPAACGGDSTGTIKVTAVGGQAPYSYLWSNGDTTATDTGLAYLQSATVTITDARGCSFTTSDSITQQHTPMYTTASITNVTCYGLGNGVIDVTVYGGSVPYSYLWGNGWQQGSESDLAGGSYYLTVTDANGCSVTSLYIVHQPDSLAITNAIVQNACHGGGNITFTPTGGSGVFTYLWSPNVSGDSAANGLAAGAYSVVVTDSHGCSVTASYVVMGDTAPLQPLCMVSSDNTNTGNLVIWEKTNKAATDSFFIYRTNTPDTNYVEVAAIPRDSLSEYDDAGANPTLTSYRYKMNLKDTCGNYSPLSNYIQTIYLQYTGNGVFVWTPYVVENEISPLVSYSLMRDTSGNGNWMIVSSSFTDTTVSDPDYAQYPGASYQVLALLNTSCTPTRGISTVASNIISHLPTGIISPTASNIQVNAFPNPFSDITNIEIEGLTGTNKYNFELYDITGRLQLSVPAGTSNHFQISRGKLAAGVYTYRLVMGEEAVGVFGKLVIQ